MAQSTPAGGHAWNKTPDVVDGDEDPVESMIKKTGCLPLHYAVIDCMADHRDWRKCQPQVKEFQACVNEHQKKRSEEYAKLVSK
uniref:CHCH domain-containing protein n=1 Tax=Plectus sambesii TaxID=2011161 RepID=A0A914WXE8_9BILA